MSLSEMLKRGRSTVLSIALMAGPPLGAHGQSGSSEFEPCLVCHGVDARGNPAVGAPALAGLEPLYVRRQLDAYRAGSRGVRGEDEFGAEMRPIALLLDDAQIARAAEYIGTLEPAVQSATVTGDAMRGETLYRTCATCHGAAGEGSAALQSPRLSGQSDWYLLRQIAGFRDGWRTGAPDDPGAARMGVAAQALTDQQAVRDVVAYINTLAPTAP